MQALRPSCKPSAPRSSAALPSLSPLSFLSSFPLALSPSRPLHTLLTPHPRPPPTHKGKVEEELNTICMDILKLLDENLIAKAEKVAQPEAIVFYKKMKAGKNLLAASRLCMS